MLQGAASPKEAQKLCMPLALATDGVSPFHYSSRSMWPIVLTNLHLPPGMRHSVNSMHLSMIVPGPKAPDDLAPYLAVIVDELLLLYFQGVQVPAASGDCARTVRAMLIKVVSDLPGLMKVIRAVQTGAKVCIVKATPFKTIAWTHSFQALLGSISK